MSDDKNPLFDWMPNRHGVDRSIFEQLTKPRNLDRTVKMPKRKEPTEPPEAIEVDVPIVDFAVPNSDHTVLTTYAQNVIIESVMLWECPVCKQMSGGKQEDHVCRVHGESSSSKASRQAQAQFREYLETTRKEIGEKLGKHIQKGYDDTMKAYAEGYRHLRENECPHCGHEYTSNYHRNHCRKLPDAIE